MQYRAKTEDINSALYKPGSKFILTMHYINNAVVIIIHELTDLHVCNSRMLMSVTADVK